MKNKLIKFEFQVQRRTLDSNPISYLICDLIRGDFLTWLWDKIKLRFFFSCSRRSLCNLINLKPHHLKITSILVFFHPKVWTLKRQTKFPLSYFLYRLGNGPCCLVNLLSKNDFKGNKNVNVANNCFSNMHKKWSVSDLKRLVHIFIGNFDFLGHKLCSNKSMYLCIHIAIFRIN